VETYPKKAGIYKLTCVNNGKIYIGKSVDINRRLKDHKRGRDGYLFKRAILKHGWESFTVEILEIVENFDKLKGNIPLLDREAYYINLFESSDIEKGYNLCKRSNDTTGIPLSKEHKEKLRQAGLGRILSKETREKISQANLGKIKEPHSDESKEKIRQAGLGRVHSKDTKHKIGLCHLGKTVSEETKKKISQARKGKPLSEEHKEKIRQAKLKKL
jgi:group I intron endonuclease